jgi:nicotinamidase-related amidase
MTRCRFRLIATLALAVLAVRPSMAADIISGWASVKTPPPPQLKPVKVNADQTALLLLDFGNDSCKVEKRTRCADTLPNMVKLLAEARSHHATVVYSTGPTGSIKDTPAMLAPQPGDPVVSGPADKFFNTDLANILKAKNIRTVIVTGNIAPGAVLYTASAAALRGFNVIVPVDGMSANDPFSELAVTWTLANSAASVSGHITLTRSDMITY